MPVICGPRGLPPGRNFLFHNKGGGRFEDVSAPSGIGKPTGCYGFTVTASDFDNDGYPDLYVACDSRPSLLYHNRKNGTFEEIGILSGTALNEDGQEQAGMGVAVADYDEDGYFDILKTNFSEDTPNLYHNSKGGNFLRRGVSRRARRAQPVPRLGRALPGCRSRRAQGYPAGQRTRVSRRWTACPAGRSIASRGCCSGTWAAGSSRTSRIRLVRASRERGPRRGAAAGDLDNDGSLEVVINNLGDRPSLLKNFGTTKNWLLVELRGVKCNRDAIGARALRVRRATGRLSGEVQAGTSFLSQNDSRLHFGLGG